MATEPLKPIGGSDKPKEGLPNIVETSHNAKAKIAKKVINNASFIIGFFLLFLVVVVFTTDINIASLADWGELGLGIFVLFFCSYSMYLTFTGSGTKAGKETEGFIKATTDYTDIKKDITDKKQQGRLREFCRYYIAEEQRNTRHSIIADVGLDYAAYESKYMGMNAKELRTETALTKSQKAAILKANKVRPIRLTPEMFFKCGRGIRGREPLSANPKTTKALKDTAQAFKQFFRVVICGIIMLDVIVEPDWATFAACCLKLGMVVMSGFRGYTVGYENIVYDTVNYMSDQTDLMKQFQQYIADNPNPIPIYAQNEVVDTAIEAESTTEQAENAD